MFPLDPSHNNRNYYIMRSIFKNLTFMFFSNTYTCTHTQSTCQTPFSTVHIFLKIGCFVGINKGPVSLKYLKKRHSLHFERNHNSTDMQNSPKLVFVSLKNLFAPDSTACHSVQLLDPQRSDSGSA